MAVAVVAVLAGCGGSGDSTASDSTPTTAGTTAADDSEALRAWASLMSGLEAELDANEYPANCYISCGMEGQVALLQSAVAVQQASRDSYRMEEPAEVADLIAETEAAFAEVESVSGALVDCPTISSQECTQAYSDAEDAIDDVRAVIGRWEPYS